MARKKKEETTVDDPADRPWGFKDLRVGWAANAWKHLCGAQIIAVRYMTEEETENSGWYSSPIIFIMKKPNGEEFAMYPMSDDEGNNGGAMGTSLPEIDTVPVI